MTKKIKPAVFRISKKNMNRLRFGTHTRERILKTIGATPAIYNEEDGCFHFRDGQKVETKVLTDKYIKFVQK